MAECDDVWARLFAEPLRLAPSGLAARQLSKQTAADTLTLLIAVLAIFTCLGRAGPVFRLYL